MTTSVIITLCLLLILAYIFDISASKTRIPSVILLLGLGYGVQQLTIWLNIPVPDMTNALPILGTVGLILIVLEGSLELELNRAKLPFVGQTALMALVPMLILSLGLAWVLQQVGAVPIKTGLANAIPLAIISSAIAIPSAQALVNRQREFITYESSLSDILGIIFFNYITLNDNIGTQSLAYFGGEMIVILLVSFVATLVLAWLLSNIHHHVKFVPIILMVVLIYAVSKVYHLPGLIFILLFGLFLGNLDELRHIRYIQYLKPDILNKEVHKFRELTTEMAFLLRALFFLLFGFLIRSDELLNPETIVWAGGISLGILLLRVICLLILRLPVFPLMFIAPRGLITILLFLSIPATDLIPLVNKSLIIQVITMTALIMMLGLLIHKPAPQEQT